MTTSLIGQIAQASREGMLRKGEFDRMFQEFMGKELNASTREVGKMFIALMLETPFKYSQEINQMVAKLKRLGVADDIAWIEKFVPEYYRK